MENEFAVVNLLGPTDKPPPGEYTHNDDGWRRQLTAAFENGYGASVIQSPMSYGGKVGLYELAVLHGDKPDLCYQTPVTGDVLGWLSEAQVIETLHKVAALPRNDACSHARPDDWLYIESDDHHAATFDNALDSMMESLDHLAKRLADGTDGS